MRYALALTALLATFTAAPASAHSLSRDGAERVALRYARSVAAEVVPRPSRVEVRSSRRRSMHVVDVRSRYWFRSGTICERIIRVSMRRDSGWVRARFLNGVDCF